MPSFKHLPTDLQLLIVDFLTIDDCYALQEVDRDLFNALQPRDSFWAKKVFEKHIQFPTKSLNLFKCSESPVPYYVPTLLEFNNFKDAKLLWDRLLQSQKDLNNALKFFGMGSEQGQLFSQRLYSILVNPTAPLPSLKRENQYLHTSSSFENFLTEIHFAVNPPASLYDVNFVSLEAACKTIESKVRKVQRRPNKVIRSHKKGQNKAINSRQDRIEMAVKRKSENRIERVFAGVQDFIKGHCLIVRNYLLSLTSGRIILKEYRRFWKEFTFSMIEMTKVLKPFEGLLTVNQANFSIWKVMVQIWLEEVYEKVALRVKTSFQTLLMDTIVQEIVNNGISTANMGQALYGSVYKRKFLKDQERRDQEKVMNLLLKSFIAISDISLYKNDQSLESIAFSQFQPKSRLISFIYPKIKSFIETTMIALNGEPNKLITALNVVKSVIDTVFNEEVSLEEIPDTFIEHKDVTCDKEGPEDPKEIAGQYKIVSRCKWNTRLSDVYQSLMEVPTFC